jgi:hypothetical protein
MSEPLRVLHAEQERRRDRLLGEHRTQIERLQLFAEKEHLRQRNRATTTAADAEPMTAGLCILRIIMEIVVFSSRDSRR